MASSEDLRDQSASPQIMGLETDLDTSSAGRSAHLLKAVPAAHLTCVINCAGGTPLSLAAPPAPPQALSPNLGPITPPMKTYTLFGGHSQSRLIQEAPLGGGHLAQTRGTLPPCRGTVASAFSSVSPLRSQEPPEAMGSPSKTVPTRSSAWEMAMDVLKAFSSCVCGQADELGEPDHGTSELAPQAPVSRGCSSQDPRPLCQDLQNAREKTPPLSWSLYPWGRGRGGKKVKPPNK